MGGVMKQVLDEQISAFVDGELDQAEAELLVRQLAADSDLLERARRFQLIGSSLRREPVVGADFIGAIHAELDEPADQTIAVSERGRWRQMAIGGGIAATVALIALVGLNFTVESQQDEGSPQIAEAAEPVQEGDTSYTVPTPAVAAGNQAFVEPRLVNYMLRHGSLTPVITRANISPVPEPEADSEQDAPNE